jgi:hypothetical protein
MDGPLLSANTHSPSARAVNELLTSETVLQREDVRRSIDNWLRSGALAARLGGTSCEKET